MAVSAMRRQCWHRHCLRMRQLRHVTGRQDRDRRSDVLGFGRGKSAVDLGAGFRSGVFGGSQNGMSETFAVRSMSHRAATDMAIVEPPRIAI